ncbi:MAG TPA: energy-coupling factor transporter transmembrane protein EcfT [Ktedonobacterales bacterium]|jgi:energy-coupling factor transport system permease protein
MLDNLPLGRYLPGNSALHHLQARTKLLLMVWLVVFLFAANRHTWHIGAYIMVLALLLLGVALSRVRPGYILRRMRLLFLLVVLTDIPALLFTPGGDTLAELGPLHVQLGSLDWTIGPAIIAADGAWFVIGFSSIFLLLFLASQLLALTTSPVAVAEGVALLLRPLRRWRVPADEFALMTLISLRFLPLMLEETNQLIKAQQSRGADFSKGSLGKRSRLVAALLVPTMYGALRRAGELATALESRGYAAVASGEQTMLYETRLQALDYVTLAVVLLSTALAYLFW